MRRRENPQTTTKSKEGGPIQIQKTNQLPNQLTNRELEALKDGARKKEEEEKKLCVALQVEKDNLDQQCQAHQAILQAREASERKMKQKLVQWKSLSNNLKEKLRKREAADGDWMAVLAQHQQYQEQLQQEANQWKAR